MRVVFCFVWTARATTAARLWHARAAWTGKYMKYVKLPLLASNFSNSSIYIEFIHWSTDAQIYFRASSVPYLHTNCTVGRCRFHRVRNPQARHTYIVCTHTFTHTIVWALTTPENGTSDTCRLIAWTIDVKHYIARGPFATASQTTQNKPKLTKRCTPQSASLPPSRPVSH